MNEIKAQLERPKVASSLDWPKNQSNQKSTSSDVYSVYIQRKHYLWCLDSVQEKHFSSQIEEETFAEKLLVAFSFGTACLLLCFCGFVVF
jgi:hypothetical protein